MKKVLEIFFNTAWSYLVPRFVKWIVRWAKIQQIDNEIEEKTKEIEEIRKEIDAFFEENPDAQEIPKELEERLRAASDNGIDGV